MEFKIYTGDTLAGEYKDSKFHQYIQHEWFDLMFRLSVDKFLETRVMPKQRWAQEHMEFYDLERWDPLAICKLTHGFKMSDPVWLKFPDDGPEVNWEFVQKQIW